MRSPRLRSNRGPCGFRAISLIAVGSTGRRPLPQPVAPRICGRRRTTPAPPAHPCLSRKRPVATRVTGDLRHSKYPLRAHLRPSASRAGIGSRCDKDCLSREVARSPRQRNDGRGAHPGRGNRKNSGSTPCTRTPEQGDRIGPRTCRQTIYREDHAGKRASR